MGKSVAFYTLGCKVNQYETEAMTEQFKSAGYNIRDFNTVCDVYIINTCSVTQLADRKSRTAVRKARKQNSEAVIAVCGCYPQTHKKEVSALPEADIVAGNCGKGKILSMVEKLLEQKKRDKLMAVTDIMEQRQFEESSVSGHGDKTRAFMKIQDGCDNYCAYCIIPYARGHIRSRSMESIRAEAEKFAEAGYKEIVLTGIHITSYGKENSSGSLLDVLLMLHEISGINRIRLGSLEFNSQLIEIAKNAHRLPKLCNHFHVSLQSGCDETLGRMGRRYTTEEYAEGIRLLRRAFPGAGVTTDIMVGFPGETLEEFMQSRDFAEKTEFSKMHIFPYSVRTGTRAAKMEGQIDAGIKKERAALLEKVDEKNVRAFARKQVGKTHSVLFEQPEGEYFVGHTTNYLTVYVKCTENIKNKIFNVKITSFSEDKLYGEITD